MCILSNKEESKYKTASDSLRENLNWFRNKFQKLDLWFTDSINTNNKLEAMNCVYVCLILQYSQDHTILSPCFDA